MVLVSMQEHADGTMARRRGLPGQAAEPSHPHLPGEQVTNPTVDVKQSTNTEDQDYLRISKQAGWGVQSGTEDDRDDLNETLPK